MYKEFMDAFVHKKTFIRDENERKTSLEYKLSYFNHIIYETFLNIKKIELIFQTTKNI